MFSAPSNTIVTCTNSKGLEVSNVAADDMVVIAGPVHIEPIIELRIDFINGVAGLYVQGQPHIRMLSDALMDARAVGYRTVWQKNDFDLDVVEEGEHFAVYRMERIK